MNERSYRKEDHKQGLGYRVRAWAAVAGVETLLVVGLIVISILAHSFNMFHYPSLDRLDDEGIYMSQAWSVLRQGQLSPYTYWYDHAPAGWILIAGWMGITGGPTAFGTAIDSGRVLMLLLHVAMVPLLYFLARKLGASIPFAAVAVFLFSVSPLAITYQRLVLLDNIMMFFILVSLNLLLDGWGRLSRVILSGVAFGIAILVKETAIFLFPVMLYLAAQQRFQHQGRFPLLGWLLPMAMVFSWYPLYALIKGELLPAGAAIGFLLFPNEIASTVFAAGDQVSLTEALKWQATRSGGGLFDLESMFWHLTRTNWLPLDPFLVAAGAFATLANLVRGIRNRSALAAGLLGLMPLIYLARGGIVFDFYILFAIPFFALNLALLLTAIFERIQVSGIQTAFAGLIVAVLLTFYSLSGSLNTLYQYKPDASMRQSLAWIQDNLHPHSRMVISDNLWTDLREPGEARRGFTDAHSHWKVASDPAVYEEVFQNDLSRIDYIVLSQGLLEDFQNTNNELALQALENSSLVKTWGEEETRVELWKVNHRSANDIDLLARSHLFINKKFSTNGAYYTSDGFVTSENQAYAMLRAVWLNQKEDFYRTWQWTQANLQKDNGLMAWLWKDGEIIDAHSAADADTDTALALLFAGRRWNDENLLEAGRHMVQAIWDHEVVFVDGSPYMTAGEWATLEEIIPLNPSYFAPYAYRVFNEVDPEDHRWWELIDSSYEVIFAAAEMPLGAEESAGLLPDWVGLDPETGELVALDLGEGRGETTRYGYEASRSYWRIALDYRYVEDGRAETFLELAGFINDEVQRKGYPSAVYAKDGEVIEEQPSVVGIAGAMAALMHLNPEAGYDLYIQHILLGASRHEQGFMYWGDPEDLNSQQWGWFAAALYADAMPNIWWYIPESENVVRSVQQGITNEK
jgi:endo-1,4-beta-D-glucanase Y/4-amino-4-deoxy-L-arabinose transferase-like glycosyltransferase